MDLLDDLAARGQLHQATDLDGLRGHLAGASRSVYAGFDPTSESLTIGNLVPLILLRRVQLAGHRPVALLGGGTGLIGDPSGKDAERAIQDRAEVERRVASQRAIMERFLDTRGACAARFVNNAEWLEPLGFIQVLRDIGKHFSVNMMIQKDSVRERLQNREHGISYTEFSYMLLQAYDFLHLYRDAGVSVQMAGSDQWGNIVAGVDLIRRHGLGPAYGLTVPLITKADGGKFGKTESGAIWLTADRTSPYAFYQFWLNAADADVKKFLLVYTFFSPTEIDGILAEHEANPAGRHAQRELARHVTEFVHGAEGLARAEAATKALFSGDISGLSRENVEELFASAPSVVLPKARLAEPGAALVELLVEGAVVKSKRESREFLEQGAILVNGERAGLDTLVGENSLRFGEVLLVRRGKKNWYVLRFR
jgi:tyrosyl-tRNA synthetase